MKELHLCYARKQSASYYIILFSLSRIIVFTARQDIVDHSPRKLSTEDNDASKVEPIPTATFTSPTSFHVHRCHSDQINDVLATYNGQTFVTAGADTNVNVFETSSGRLQRTLIGLFVG